jgi:hypothetical protein
MGALPEIPEIVGKGQKVIAYFLNRKQAIYFTAKSDTAVATDTTMEIIERFDAYERNLYRPPPERPVLPPDARAVIGGIMKRVIKSQLQPLLQMQAVDHAHIIALKQEIAALKAVPVMPVERGACGDYWPMLEIVKAAGIGPRGGADGRLRTCAGSAPTWPAR